MTKPKLIRLSGLVALAIVAILILVSMNNLWENVGAEEIIVIQAWRSGTLTWHTTPGIKWQGYGKVTRYNKASQLNCVFSGDVADDKHAYPPLPMRFNDAGKSDVALSVRWENPLDTESLTKLHTKYTSQGAIEKDLVLQTLNRAVYMTGPLLSSRESYAERRPDLLRFIEDQAIFGVYQTKVTSKKVPDPLTGVEKNVDVTETIADSNAPNGMMRQTISPFDEFGIVLVSGTLTINKISYSKAVQDQIDAQQQATMKVQTAIAEAKEAEQKTITVAEKGKADAAKAKWDQEIIKAQMVTEAQQTKEVATISAEQRRDVAALDKEAAALTKAQQILLGEGEARRKELNLNADGALQIKLDHWLKAQEAWAQNVPKYQGNWVPLYSSGSNGQQQALGGAMDIQTSLSIMMLKQLGLDFTMPKGTTTGAGGGAVGGR